MINVNHDRAYFDDILEKLTTVEILLNEYAPFANVALNTRIVQEAQDHLYSAKSTVEYMQNPETRLRTLRTLLDNRLVFSPMPGEVVPFAKQTQNIHVLENFEKDIA